MQLEVTDNNKSTYSYIRDGKAGNVQTIYRMINIVINTVTYDRGFNNLVNQLVIEKGFNAYTPQKDVLHLVYSFIRNHVTYLPDKAGKVESIKSARETLTDGYGDCDDLSILAASMLGVLGFENTDFVWAEYSTNENHIYIQTFDRQHQRFVLDLSLPQDKAQLNYEIPAQKKQVFKIFNKDAVSALFGSIYNLKIIGKTFIKDTVNAIPYGLQFLPLGLIPANLVQQSVNLITQSDITTLSLNKLGNKINSELDGMIKLIRNNQIADNVVMPYTFQIVAQLTAYQVDESEKESFLVIKKSIYNKVKYIESLLNDKDTSIELNPKGMLVAGSAILGFIGYQLYKQGSY